MSVRNMKFHYLSDTPCDMCDGKVTTAVIEDLVGNISYICENCLRSILTEFDRDNEEFDNE